MTVGTIVIRRVEAMQAAIEGLAVQARGTSQSVGPIGQTRAVWVQSAKRNLSEAECSKLPRKASEVLTKVWQTRLSSYPTPSGTAKVQQRRLAPPCMQISSQVAETLSRPKSKVKHRVT